MTTTIHHLSADILDHVFQHTDGTTLKECRLVCVSWYLLTTPQLFRSIQINSASQIAEFIDFHENPASDQLVPFGKYVKRVTTGEDRGMAVTRISLENFATFAKYCPKVTSVSISPTACEGSLCRYLLKVDDNIKWKLHRLDRFYYDQTFKLDHYYKYKDTIKVIKWLEDTLEFHFVIDFPLLEELALPSTVVITNIQDFMFICNACSNLTDLDLYTDMDDHTSLMTDFAVCPSLNTLSVRCRSLIPKVLVDYITTGLVNLSNITFWTGITSIQSNFGEIYKQLEDFLFAPQKKAVSLTLKAEIGHKENYEQIYTMIDECLNIACSPSKLKACNSIKWTPTNLPEFTIDLCKSWNHTIECQISLPIYLFICIVRKNDFISSKMPNFHKMCLKGKYMGIYTSKYAALFMERACNLQELTLYWYRLKDTYDCVYESVRILRIEKSWYCPGFFNQLAISFPNLKELYLYKARMFDGVNYFRDILIELDDLYLEMLSLTTDEWLDSAQTPERELVCVEIKGRCQYIKVCAGEVPNTITNEEGAALWECLPGKHRYIIICNAPARFELNNVYIELMI